MVVIERKDVSGNCEYKRFLRLKDAFNWLGSLSVKQDIDRGFEFSFTEETNERELKEGG